MQAHTIYICSFKGLCKITGSIAVNAFHNSGCMGPVPSKLTKGGTHPLACHLLLLLLLLSCFSRVRLCATPWTAAHQAPPSLGFSSQEHRSGLHFLLQCMKVKSESEVAQSCLTLSDPMDGSLPGSSIHGVFQARVLEWVPLPSP